MESDLELSNFVFYTAAKQQVLMLIALICLSLQGYNNVSLSQPGQISVPEKIAEDTVIIDLQNNDITEIKEDDFIGLHKLYVRSLQRCRVGFKYEQTHRRGMEKLKISIVTLLGGEAGCLKADCPTKRGRYRQISIYQMGQTCGKWSGVPL